MRGARLARVTCLHTRAAHFNAHFPVHCHENGLNVNEEIENDQYLSKDTKYEIEKNNNLNQIHSIEIKNLNILHCHNNDIGSFMNKNLSDADKHLVLTNLWVQPSNYIFPLTKKNEKRGLQFQYKWFKEFQ